MNIYTGIKHRNCFCALLNLVLRSGIFAGVQDKGVSVGKIIIGVSGTDQNRAKIPQVPGVYGLSSVLISCHREHKKGTRRIKIQSSNPLTQQHGCKNASSKCTLAEFSSFSHILKIILEFSLYETGPGEK